MVNLLSPELQAERPNILWLSTEDMSPHLGCYGDEHARTPNIDKLAAQGVLYKNAFVPAPVCAVCRSSIITGVYAPSLGTHHMRSRVKPPPEIRCFTEYLRDAGYFCTNNAKEDYNFRTPKTAWDESSGRAHWRNRPDAAQPFFAVFNYTGTHESSVRGDEPKYSSTIAPLKPEELHDPAALELPPYYPDTPKVRAHWARYYNTISALDKWVGQRLAELADAGLADDTIVVFWSDHGAGLPRAKRWLYDSGLRVPLIVRVPDKWRSLVPSEPGERRDQLVSLIDLAPTMLDLADLQIPPYMQGQPFLAPPFLESRPYVYASRDRMDESYDVARAVRDKKYKYIRNYMPWRPYAQYQSYGENNDIMRELRRLHSIGELHDQQKLFMQSRRPPEELFDLERDPHELRNLALEKDHAQTLKRLSDQLDSWMCEMRDLGIVPEGMIERLVVSGDSPYSLYRDGHGKQRYRALADAAWFHVRISEPGFIDYPLLMAKELSFVNSYDLAVQYWRMRTLAQPASKDDGDPFRLMKKGSACQQIKQYEQQFNSDDAIRVMAAEAMLSNQDNEPKVREFAIDALVDVYQNGDTRWDQVAAACVLDLYAHRPTVAKRIIQVNDQVAQEIGKTGQNDVRADTLRRWVERFKVRIADAAKQSSVGALE